MCVAFQNSKVDHQMQGSITYKIESRLYFQMRYSIMITNADSRLNFKRGIVE